MSSTPDPLALLPPPDPGTFCTLLLGWYDTHARTLPWRGPHVTPYETLVSEVMLQQTRVDTVKPRYAAFLERFPTVESLAAAPVDDVLALWSGLGYYSRARNLHAASHQIVDAGHFPTDVAGLLALKGVGTYIAGAVGSIALGLPEPAVDGNLERVLARLVRSPGGRRPMTDVARTLISGAPDRAGDLNQALMDLGSSICGPRAPRCAECPLSAICGAANAPDPAAWPERKTRKKAPERAAVAGVLVDPSGRILVGRRPASGLFGGLYELPGRLLPSKSRAQPGPRALRSAWKERLGLVPEVLASLGTVTHTLTHMKLTLHLFEVQSDRVPTTADFYTGIRWESPETLDALGISTLTRKAMKVVTMGAQQELFRGHGSR